MRRTILHKAASFFFRRTRPGYIIAMLTASRLVEKNSLDFPIWGEGTVQENIDEGIRILSLHGGVKKCKYQSSW